MKKKHDRVEKYLINNEIENTINYLLTENNLSKEHESAIQIIRNSIIELKDKFQKDFLSLKDFQNESNKIRDLLLKIINTPNRIIQISDGVITILEPPSRPYSSIPISKKQKFDSSKGYIFRNFYFSENRVGIFTPYLSR